jgi:hypothetical protein
MQLLWGGGNEDMTVMNYMNQREDGRSEIIGTIGNNGNRVAQSV